jgi:hypothetical protein
MPMPDFSACAESPGVEPHCLRSDSPSSSICIASAAIRLPLQSNSTPREPLGQLRVLLNEVEDVRRVISEGRPPVPWPSIEPRLAELAAQLAAQDEHGPGGAVTMLLERLIDDIKGLLSAAGYSHSGHEASGDFVPSPS